MAANGVRKVQMRKRARGGSPDRVMMFSNGGGRLSGDQCVDVGRRLILLLGVEAVEKGGWEHERLWNALMPYVIVDACRSLYQTDERR